MKNSDPTAIKLLKGVDKKDPSRINKNEPIGDPIGEAPKYFSDEKSDLWNEIKNELVDGVLQKSDRRLFAEFCELVYLACYDRSNFTSSDRKDFISLGSKFGMSASDRQNVSVPKKQKENRFNKYK